MDIRSSIESYSSYSKPTLTSTQLLPKGTLAPCSCNCRSFQIKSKFQTDVQWILPWFHHRGDTSEILHDLLIFGRKQRLSEGWHARDAQCQAGTLPWVGRRGETCQNLPTTVPYDLATNDGSWSENMGTKTTSKRIVCFTRRVSFPLFSTSMSLGVYIHKICAGAAFWQRPTQSLATLIPAWTWWGSRWRKMVKMGRCNLPLCVWTGFYLDVWWTKWFIQGVTQGERFVWSTWCISGGCDWDKQDTVRETANDSDLRWLQYIILGQPFLPQLHNSQLFFVGSAWHNRPTHMRGEEHWFARLLAQPFRFDLCLSVARMDVSHGIAAWLEVDIMLIYVMLFWTFKAKVK